MRIKMNIFTLTLVFIGCFYLCEGLDINNAINYAVRQYSLVAEDLIDEDNQYISTGNHLNTEWNKSTNNMSWTIGFYGGTLWKLYKLTQDEYWKTQAIRKQETVQHRQFDTNTHDVGFVIMSTFGNGLQLTGNSSYEPIIIQTADSLCTRFHNLSGVIRSWNNDPAHGGVEGEVKVIADNMMNLELLFKATELSGNQTYADIAISHARKTIENHFREDGERGIFHVVAYHETNGTVKRKYNWQGYADDSTWARGLAWVVHGYATSYEITQEPDFLVYAEKSANYFISHLPSDSVPYYDFDAPNTEVYTPRDTSAAAIVSHALLKLFLATRNNFYLQEAEIILDSLNSPNYRADGKDEYNIPAILVNGTVFFNERNFNTAIIYGDMYFLEAIDLYKQIQNMLH